MWANILVIYRGRIVADLMTEATDVETVGRFMGGLHDSAHEAARVQGFAVPTDVEEGDRVN